MSEEAKRAGAEIKRTRRDAERAVEGARRVARKLAGEGEPESVIARDMDVSRTTIRKWLGK